MTKRKDCLKARAPEVGGRWASSTELSVHWGKSPTTIDRWKKRRPDFPVGVRITENGSVLYLWDER